MKNNENEYIFPAANMWIIYLLPFGDKNTKYITEYQQNCINKNLTGIGYLDDDGKDQLSDEMLEKLPQNEKKSKEKIKNSWDKIEKNDIVLMRLRNGRYYLGRVSGKQGDMEIEKDLDIKGFDHCDETGPYSSTRLSRKLLVHKWHEYHEDQVPSIIVGRMSQSRHSTLERIADDQLKQVIAFMLCEKGDGLYKGAKKPVVSEKDFANHLHAAELEDLVYLYMKNEEENKGYELLPSTCKNSTIKYEFYMFKEGQNPITCQVKNKEKLDLKVYETDSEYYQKIYLFSNQGYENEALENDHIRIIKPEELYKRLLKESVLRNKIEKYCTLEK